MKMRAPLLTLILLSIAACGERTEAEGCLLLEEGVDTCPDPADLKASDLFEQWDCDNKVVRILSTDTPSPTTVGQVGDQGCCYDVITVDDPFGECIVGRPYRDHGAPVLANAPAVDGPAAPWLEIAIAEHASIAAFARLQLQLMALGAPLELLQDTARAMSDEVRHAHHTQQIAEQLAGCPLPIGRFPLPAVTPTQTLVELAVETVLEGCIGETLSAVLTRAAADHVEPHHAAVLRRISDDEDRHAALSWGIVSWAIAAGGPPVRQAVREAFLRPHPPVLIGLLSNKASLDLCKTGLEQVIRPAMVQLLAA